MSERGPAGPGPSREPMQSVDGAAVRMPTARPALLADPRLRRLFAARTISVLGTALSPVAFAFAMLGQPGYGPTQLGLVVGAQAICEAVVPLIGGALADRLSRSRLMAGCDVVAAACMATVAILFASGHAALPVLIALAALHGTSAALFFPALSGLITQIVVPQRLQAANGLLRLGTNTARISGPLLGGLIVATTAPAWGLAADALSFAVSAALIVGLRTGAPQRSGPVPTLVADLRDGWHEFASRTWLWTLVLAGAFMNLAFNAGFSVLGPVTARLAYGGAAAWSAVLSGFAVGMVAGTLVAIRIPARRPLAVAAAAFVPMAGPFALLALQAPLAAVVAAAVVAGICLDILAVLWDTALQRGVPAASIGRVTSYDMVGSFALAPLGVIAAGPTAAAIGVAPAMAGCALLIAGAGLAALAVPSVRRLSYPDGATPPAPTPDTAAAATTGS